MSAADRERFKADARKEEQETKLTAPITDEPQASTSGEPAKKARSKQAQKQPAIDEPSSWPKPARGPDHPLLPELVRAAHQKAYHRQGTVRRVKSAQRPAPAVPEEVPAAIRKSTRPLAPSCKQVRAAISAPPPYQRAPGSSPTKRRVEMTPSTLAKKVAHRSDKTSRDIADELTSTYAMPTAERRANENLIRAMKAANREFCSRIRRALPLNRSKDIDRFLTVMEQQCQEAERLDSDEFV